MSSRPANAQTGPRPRRSHAAGVCGFTLLETTVALLLLLVIALGSATLFSFSIYNNSGASDRAAALAIAEQVLEALRNVEFSNDFVDPSLAAGTFVQTGVVRDGRTFTVTKVVDDDPATLAVDVNPATTLKIITVTVVPQSIGSGWASGTAGSVVLVDQRARFK